MDNIRAVVVKRAELDVALKALAGTTDKDAAEKVVDDWVKATSEYAGVVTPAVVLSLLDELEGERKANALLNAGMGSVCDGRDELKHRVRELEAEIKSLRGVLGRKLFMCERCGGTGLQPDRCYDPATSRYDSPAGTCRDCDGDGYLGPRPATEKDPG